MGDAPLKAADLGLVGLAAAGASLLEQQHPEVKFLSGRRNREQQARAMAKNILANREYVHETYLYSPIAAALQDWVDQHPEADDVDTITTGFLGVMASFSDAGVARISRHLAGLAFDVQPDGIELAVAIRNLPGLDRFLTQEAGLERWHAQFIEEPEDDGA